MVARPCSGSERRSSRRRVFEVSVFGNALGAGPELARQRSLNNPNAPRPHRLLKALHELIEVVWNIAKPGQDFGLTDLATLSVESERDHSRAALARSDLLSLVARLILARCHGLGGRHELLPVRFERLDHEYSLAGHQRAWSVRSNSPARMAAITSSARASTPINVASDTESWGSSGQVTRTVSPPALTTTSKPRTVTPSSEPDTAGSASAAGSTGRGNGPAVRIATHGRSDGPALCRVVHMAGIMSLSTAVCLAKEI